METYQAYLHTNGSVIVKRFIREMTTPYSQDDSTFIKKNMNPFEARDFIEARVMAEKTLNLQ